MGPYQIEEDFGNNSYRVVLPPNLKSWGIHNMFPSSLLRIYEPNDDWLFPGRTDEHVLITDEQAPRDLGWEINRVLCHKGKGQDSAFEVEWKTGDKTWLLCRDLICRHPLVSLTSHI
ncbi:hypothetical protein GLOTRDRAFT_35697 [Gloeophyllum trabeum ATCC 11539]|uniref:Chromo domain-containing protein n=1 Tax=Gloeophyllum trabeum (strain ATCC 11539 / FP-39264 / Madison 617) TaxID=670483 RepID=S7RUV8_GLOTA|nr:uncharacterized protein GLOTRDRAFT_35697 [Gloeophyllum trabeum ATCC 11539]EPQ58520.1 hypothetical protein GLOTRDRAFT_35697 [Gloeophyllum trabeum ATCC 11539]